MALFWHSCITYLLTLGVEPVSNSAALLGPYNQSHQTPVVWWWNLVSANIRAYISMLSKHLNPFFNQASLNEGSTSPHLPQKENVTHRQHGLSVQKNPFINLLSPISPSCVLNLTEMKSWRSLLLYICAWKGAFFNLTFVSCSQSD